MQQHHRAAEEENSTSSNDSTIPASASRISDVTSRDAADEKLRKLQRPEHRQVTASASASAA